MFSLAIIKESVKLSPNKLRNDFVQAISLALNQKYCNRIVINLGLCISVFDVLEAGDPYVHCGEASAYVKVLEGKVRSSSEEGIHVSLGFFDDILIPPSCMQPDCVFDPNEQVWAWNYDGNKMFLDNGEFIRFRILSESFTEIAPLQKDALMAARAASLSAISGGDLSAPPMEEAGGVSTPAPYKLVASIAEDGLGLSRWWLPAEE